MGKRFSGAVLYAIIAAEMRWKNAARGKILVCLSGSPTNARVVRAAAKIAEAFHGTLTALFVEPANYDAEPDSRLAENIRLAKQLGAQIRTLYGDDAAAVIAEYARVSAQQR